MVDLLHGYRTGSE